MAGGRWTRAWERLLARALPGGLDETLLRAALRRRSAAAPPAEALRFLLGLDAFLYELETEAAVAYEGGLHPKHRLMRYHDFFVSRLRPDERVLDVGCGTGALACDLAGRAGARVLAIDLLPRHIELARARYVHPKIEYRIGDATIDLPEERFDAVVLSNVLEHLDARPAFLRRLQVSSGAKRFLVRVPLFDREWRVPLRKELGLEWRLDATHRTEYTFESFSEEIAEAGMRFVSHETRWGELWCELAPAE